jgi:ADP-heptose:LPS heptosyltransferase
MSSRPETMLPQLFFSVRLPTLAAIFWRRHIRRSLIQGVSQKEPLSFIVFRLDALGDVVLTTPLFRALRQAFPGSQCTVVVQKAYKSLLVTNPHVNEVLTLPKIDWRWLPQRLGQLLAALALYWTQLRYRHFDYALSPRWDVDEHLATFLCILTNASRRVGYCSHTSRAKLEMNRGFDAAYDLCLPPGPVRHEVIRNLALAEQLGATIGSDALDIHITERDRRCADRSLGNVSPATKLIALGVGAQSSGRRWPLRNYVEVVEQIGGELQIQPVIVCSEVELGMALQLNDLLKKPAIIVSGARLREVCAVLERCQLFVGNDSGCAHLAAAMSCGTIVVSRHPLSGDCNHFNSPTRFAPYAPRVRVLQPATGRGNCTTACGVDGPHCITGVTPQEVVAAALEMMASETFFVAAQVKPWMTRASQRLLSAHSAEAVQLAVESLRSGVDRPSL